jgi:hypothetical protein
MVCGRVDVLVDSTMWALRCSRGVPERSRGDAVPMHSGPDRGAHVGRVDIHGQLHRYAGILSIAHVICGQC